MKLVSLYSQQVQQHMNTWNISHNNTRIIWTKQEME